MNRKSGADAAESWRIEPSYKTNQQRENWQHFVQIGIECGQGNVETGLSRGTV